ncbi:hypothetical protein C8F04DRAFT_1396250 [Mycena alexandri]|uniref:Uncharacterized protein n=1 Tax=Mycena alexandri TaxID=1745969 RepID=A0AAD6SSA8_9AGAR|nr:hypothetical protein C8F04DRAFT_1396250 [Mycena alexandri]
MLIVTSPISFFPPLPPSRSRHLATVFCPPGPRSNTCAVHPAATGPQFPPHPARSNTTTLATWPGPRSRPITEPFPSSATGGYVPTYLNANQAPAYLQAGHQQQQQQAPGYAPAYVDADTAARAQEREEEVLEVLADARGADEKGVGLGKDMGVIHGRAGAVPRSAVSLEFRHRRTRTRCAHLPLFPPAVPSPLPPSCTPQARARAVKSTAPVAVCIDSARVMRRIRMPRTNPVQANGAGVLRVLHPRAGNRELRAQPTRARRVGVHLHGRASPYIPCRSRVRMPFHTYAPLSHTQREHQLCEEDLDADRYPSYEC